MSTNKLCSATGDPAQDDKLLLPFVHLLQVPGKQVRCKLTLAFNYWLKISPEKLQAVGNIVQMLHNASLLCMGIDKETLATKDYDSFPRHALNMVIDDIQDNSILRRGIPVAHSIYGVASTINAANYVFFVALEKVLELGNAEATAVYTEQMLELHRGQGMEIFWRDNFQCPSEEEYKQMTIRKTGGLFMLAIRLMQIFSENKSDFTKLASILGLYFQIRDDYCNLCSTEYTENKSYCEDLTEGKFSFPIIHSIHNNSGDQQVLQILRQRTTALEVKKYCIELLEKQGSFDYTRRTLEQLDNDARKEVETLGGNPLMISLLDDILSWKDTEKKFKKYEF